MRGVKSQRRHLWVLDLVRFFAALLVAFFHLTWDAEKVWFGWVGVQIFFVISGFVIAQSANSTTPVKFIKSRFLRLYPAAWLCALLGVTVALVASRHTDHLLQRLTDSMLLFPAGPFLGSAYWTLPIEIAFYGLIFLVLLAGIFDRLLAIASVLCVASSVYIVLYSLQQAGLLHGPDLEFGYDWKNMSLLRHGIYFATGIFIWLWSERRLSPLGAAMLALAVAVAPLEITCRTAELALVLSVHLQVSAVWLVPVLVWLSCSLLIAWSARWEMSVPPPTAGLLRVTRSLGLVTYPLYLLHESVGIAARNVLMHLHASLMLSAIAAIAVTAAMALLIVQFAEPAVRGLMGHVLNATAERLRTVIWLQRLSRPGGTV